MAVANALGSNVFDIMLGLGVPWTIKNGFLGGDIVFAGADGTVGAGQVGARLYFAGLRVRDWQLCFGSPPGIAPG